jgi:hypothetical protein
VLVAGDESIFWGIILTSGWGIIVALDIIETTPSKYKKNYLLKGGYICMLA